MRGFKITFWVLLAVAAPAVAYGQACPACSNPSLQSSERLEAGIDTLYRGDFRLTFNMTNGFDYQGGHLNSAGLSAAGQVIAVPLHEHVVSLDFLRMEVNMEYTFKTNWSAWLRIPYDIKMQDASIIYIDPISEAENDAIIRNRDIHHRSETYVGFSDLRLLVARRINQFLGEKGRLDIAVGTSIPTGRTAKNPLTAGQNGYKHMHIQFGSGTFDPLIELHYATFLDRRWSLAVFTINRLPVSTNNLGYRGALETTSGLSLGYTYKPWVTLRGTVANFTQSQALWDDVKDPNSGLVSFNGNIAMTFRHNGLLVSPGYRFPLYQKTLSPDGDTFEYGSTFLLNISHKF